MQAAADNRALGLALGNLRDLSGLDGREVADQLGWDKDKVYRLESGKMARPTIGELEALAGVYGYTLEELRNLATILKPHVLRLGGNGDNTWWLRTPDDLQVSLPTPSPVQQSLVDRDDRVSA